MPAAVIFDFDGVIADTEKIHFQAFAELLNGIGYELDWDRYWNNYLGYTDKECFEEIAKHENVSWSEEYIRELIDKKQVIFDELVRKGGAIIDGVPEFIGMLRENNVPIAICSGALLADIESVFAGGKLCGVDPVEVFEEIVTADDVVNGKPDPEGYQLTLSKLNKKLQTPVDKGHCLVVEDSHWGLEAAIAAGMKTLAVTNTYPEDELSQKADMVVRNLAELSFEDIQRLFS